MLFLRRFSRPPMTEVTMIRAATPSIIPMAEKSETKEAKRLAPNAPA